VRFINMSDYNRGARVYWFAVVGLGLLAGLGAILGALSLGRAEWAQFVVLLSLVIISSARPLPIPNTIATVTAADTFVFLGAIFLGTPAAVLLGMLDSLRSSMRTSKRATSWLIAPSVMGLSVLLSSQVFYWALRATSGVSLDKVGAHAPLGLDQLLVPLVAMALTQYVANGVLVAAFSALKSRRRLWECWREGYLWTSWTFFAAAVAAGFVYEAIKSFGLVYVLLSVPVVVATYATYKTYFERVNEKTREAAEMGRIHLATVEALATAIDAKDQTTHCHVRRVQLYTQRMGELMGLSANEIKALKAGALLHDVGKLAVPDHILNKPGKLTAAEFEKMKVHTSVGAQILERVGFPYPVVPVVRHHHERWDGRGYPDGLKGEEIPITARILSVVDCFDSVREDRPYRRGMTVEEAGALLRRGAGTHFDARVVELFLKHLPEFEDEVERLGLNRHGFTSEEFEPRALVEGDGADPHLSTQPEYLEQIKNAHREVYALYEIARTFGSSLDVEDTLSALVDKVGQIVPFDTCAVYLYDEVKRYAEARHVAGRHSDIVRERCVAFGEGAVGFVLANRQPAHLFDPMLDFKDTPLPEGSLYRSMLALPLVKDERLLGALAVYSFEPRRYTDDHMRVLDTIVNLASDALANAADHAEAESNALTDTLTGLPNARALHVRFDEEVSRARRTRRPFQLVMLDLDNFKRVNDTFGHKIGDQVLREVARLMSAQLREYDFLARYAGDEFVAILQDMPHEQVAELRERIERVVSNYALRVRPGEYARVGISVGASAYGAQGDTLDQLLIAADQAMYSVKSHHKSQSARPAADPSPELNTGRLASTAIN
ncbi:MAG TPA: diguanylate cyclase, partial [Pyrinomonadaceae bacterium]|nr:diguanylate cyclase [Pyrinomonadaceae bacterium]